MHLQAIEWAITPVAEGGGGFSHDEAAPEFRTITRQEVAPPATERLPRRAAAVAGVQRATRALESVQQRCRRELKAAQEAAAQAEAEVERDAAETAALENAVRAQQKRPPLTKKEWTAHMYSGICPTFEYILERVAAGGDRYAATEFFRGARIIDPSHAKTLSREQAFALIDKLAHYPIMARGGEESIVARLKKTWEAYRQNAVQVTSRFRTSSNGKKDSSAITTWHYRVSLHASTDQAGDKSCRYCPNKSSECSCYSNLGVWWEACQLAALVLPSSATAERVFSLTKNLFGEQQTSLLSNAIRLGCLLPHNK